MINKDFNIGEIKDDTKVVVIRFDMNEYNSQPDNFDKGFTNIKRVLDDKGISVLFIPNGIDILTMTKFEIKGLFEESKK